MRFLIIDDEENKVQEFIKTVQGIEGHESDTFTHKIARNSGLYELMIEGSDGLGKMRLDDSDRKYDVLVLDLNLPLLDDDRFPEKDMGLEVLSELNRKKWTIPVIIYSSEPRQLEQHYSHIKGYVTYGYYLKSVVEPILATLK